MSEKLLIIISACFNFEAIKVPTNPTVKPPDSFPAIKPVIESSIIMHFSIGICKVWAVFRNISGEGFAFVTWVESIITEK